MTRATRLGRKGRADVRLDRDDGSIIWLTAYEIRAAYRELYANRTRSRNRRGLAEVWKVRTHLDAIIDNLLGLGLATRSPPGSNQLVPTESGRQLLASIESDRLHDTLRPKSARGAQEGEA